MRKNKLSEKIELYDTYKGSLVIFFISIILFCVILFAWIGIENSELSYCAELDYSGSCMNAHVYDGGVVRILCFAPILFISFVAFLVFGIKAFLARKKLGRDYTKVRKIARNNTQGVKEKDYYDDSF